MLRKPRVGTAESKEAHSEELLFIFRTLRRIVTYPSRQDIRMLLEVHRWNTEAWLGPTCKGKEHV